MRIGVDIGGNHIGVGLVNEQGEILAKKEKDLQNKGTDLKTIVIETIKTYIIEILKENNMKKSDINYIGIAYPSALHNGKQGISVNLGIDGETVKKEIKEHFEIPVYMKNDAKCAAICEKKIRCNKRLFRCCISHNRYRYRWSSFFKQYFITDTRK